MTYIWWVVTILLLCFWVMCQSISVPLGQRRLQALLRMAQTAASMILAIMIVVRYGWLVGGVVSIGLIVLVMAAARIKIIHSLAQKVYTAYLVQIQPWVARQRWLDYLSEQTPLGKKIGLESYDELASVISNAGFLRPTEEDILQAVITSRDHTARDCMTPLSSVATVSASDVIGPLLLDELHRTHHTDFAVINEDHVIIGTVQLKQLIEMSHVSSSVRDVMQTHVVRVKPDMSLREVIRHLLDQHAWMCIVHDNADMGIVTLHHATVSLLGKSLK